MCTLVRASSRSSTLLALVQASNPIFFFSVYTENVDYTNVNVTTSLSADVGWAMVNIFLIPKWMTPHLGPSCHPRRSVCIPCRHRLCGKGCCLCSIQSSRLGDAMLTANRSLLNSVHSTCACCPQNTRRPVRDVAWWTSRTSPYTAL